MMTSRLRILQRQAIHYRRMKTHTVPNRTLALPRLKITLIRRLRRPSRQLQSLMRNRFIIRKHARARNHTSRFKVSNTRSTDRRPTPAIPRGRRAPTIVYIRHPSNCFYRAISNPIQATRVNRRIQSRRARSNTLSHGLRKRDNNVSRPRAERRRSLTTSQNLAS